MVSSRDSPFPAPSENIQVSRYMRLNWEPSGIIQNVFSSTEPRLPVECACGNSGESIICFISIAACMCLKTFLMAIGVLQCCLHEAAREDCQNMRNAAAHMLLDELRVPCASPLLQELHWIPVAF